jgi:hypothetical protein
MSAVVRFRSGIVDLHKVPVAAPTVIAPGDLVYLDEGKAKPALLFPMGETLGATKAAFAKVFIGIAHEGSGAGQTADISVDLSPLAVYEMNIAPGASLFGGALAIDGTATALRSHQLIATTTANQAIARVARPIAEGETTARVMFASAFSVASANASAAVG